MKNHNKEQQKAKRTQLVVISRGLQELVKMGEIDTVNEGLIRLYMEDDPEITEFNTFSQWKERGATIKKGSKAFLVWGQPRRIERTEEGEAKGGDSKEGEEDQNMEFYPICNLFANTQVITLEEKQGRKRETEVQHIPQEEKEALPF